MARRVLGALAVYFLVHVALRVLLSDSVELDEAEQIIATQDLRLLYGSQPPLYVWIQALAFRVLGLNVFALTITKHVLLFLTYVFVYASARRITGDTRCGLFAALSLLLIPQISVESHRTLAHSVIVTTVAAGTVLALVRTLHERRIVDYAVLGLALGLGVLSKYNYLLFAVPLLLAASSVERFRPAMASRRMLVALGSMLAVVGPHLYAVVTHAELATRRSAELKMNRADSHFDALLHGGGDVLLSVAWLLALMSLVCLALFARSRPRGRDDAALLDHARMLGRTFAIAIGAALIGVVAFRVPEVKDRWFQPLLCIPPVYVATRLARRVDGRRLAWLGAAACLAGVSSLGWLYARTAHPALVGRYVRLNLPLHALADALRADGFTGGVIASERREYAGGLRLFFDDSIALEVGFSAFETPATAPWLVVWKVAGNGRAPPGLERLVAERRGVLLADQEPQRFESLYRRATTDSIAFDYVILPPER
jgi:4-amino-4-deoxy-L-arabinose transferase-like glycosyltransferase